MEWTDRLEGGRWIEAALTTFAVDVCSLVPAGFEAYVRIFHPFEDGRRWADVAAEHGRIAHATMQVGWIREPIGTRFDPWDDDKEGDPDDGTLPVEQGLHLAQLLARHTSTPEDIWFAVWDGWGWNHELALMKLTPDGLAIAEGTPPRDLRRHRRLRVPNREYHLLHGALDELSAFLIPEDERGMSQSPNIWWPADHAWCVATEIDLQSTFVGGSQAAVAAILGSDLLEALPIEPSADCFRDDPLNKALG